MLVLAQLDLALDALFILFPLLPAPVLLSLFALDLPFLATLLTLLVPVLLVKHGLVRLILSFLLFFCLLLGSFSLLATKLSFVCLAITVDASLLLVEGCSEALSLLSATGIRVFLLVQTW